ncbi:MAG: serine hydrolase [Saprospiraceae bacterium]|jgi:CubicO group peptidase (beta-lactamase class C family)/putative intracellular protease/amidase|nr:serine hydrolase [Saprospiraceae bacterium]
MSKLFLSLGFFLLFTNIHAQNRILFVTSNQHFYGNTKINTSNHFGEIVIPYDILTNAGIEVDFISPKGGAIPIGYISTSNPTHKKYLYDGMFMNKLANTRKPSEINASDYAAIYYSGGGAAMFGVAEDTTIQSIARNIYNKNGVVSTLCHGTAGIAFLKDDFGKSLYEGRKITGYPDSQEDRNEAYYKTFPFIMDKAIHDNKGHFVFSEKENFYVVDGRFVTGQDPSAAASVANEIIKQLHAGKLSDTKEKSDLDLIKETLMDYIEGSANGEPQRLRKAFHPDFNLYTVAKDTLWIRSGEQYIANFKVGEKSNRIGRIISVDFEKDAAIAKVEIIVPGWRTFIDYLLLLKYEGSWKIVHKSYTFHEIPKLTHTLDNSTTEKAKKLNDILSKYHQYDLFNGSVLIAKNGKEIFKNSFGKANFSWNINNTPNTKFRIGSLTKQFTALLILQLKQEGKLNLEDKISKHLPWYYKNTGNKITIHHLLSMTSGLPNYTDGTTPIMEQEELNPKEFALKYFKDSLLFEPGNNISYCNTGYYILGMIIEAVSKKSYETVLQENVFDVLGMKNSGVEYPGQVIGNLANGHYFYMGEYIVAQSVNPKVYAFSTGAIYSTVEDLFLWDKSFYTDKLLSAENKKLMCTKYLPNYGYGVAVNNMKNYLGTNRDITFISHDGGLTGYSSYMARIPEDSIFIILLDNTRAGMRGGELVAIANDILSVLYDVKAELPKPLASIDLMKVIKLKSVDEGLQYFENTIKATRTAYNFMGLESSLNAIGYHYLSNGDMISAIKILKLNTEEFPQSSNAYDSLGEAFYKNKQIDFALKYYKKSLELDPKNDNAKKMIEEIKLNRN